MSEIFVLKIVDNISVRLGEVVLGSTDEVALALEEIHRLSPNAVISIEVENSTYYEAIGMAIYGGGRAGFSGERLRILVGGKLVIS